MKKVLLLLAIPVLFLAADQPANQNNQEAAQAEKQPAAAPVFGEVKMIMVKDSKTQTVIILLNDGTEKEYPLNNTHFVKDGKDVDNARNILSGLEAAITTDDTGKLVIYLGGDADRLKQNAIAGGKAAALNLTPATLGKVEKINVKGSDSFIVVRLDNGKILSYQLGSASIIKNGKEVEQIKGIYPSMDAAMVNENGKEILYIGVDAIKIARTHPRVPREMANAISDN